MKDEVKVFDVLKAREVMERVHNFLGILIRENLVKDAPFLKEGELENESDLADDVWEVLQVVPRNCDVGTTEEQYARIWEFCRRHKDGLRCVNCPVNGVLPKNCALIWAQMPYDREEGNEQR